MNVNNHSPAVPENGCFLRKECDFIGRNIKNNNEEQNKKVDIKFFQDNLQKMGYKYDEQYVIDDKGKTYQYGRYYIPE